MTWAHTATIAILTLAGSMTLGLSWIAWRRRAAEGARELALLMTAATIWAYAGVFHEFSMTVAGRLTWTKLSYLGVATVPVFWYLFIRKQINPRYALGRRQRYLLWIIPGITLLLVFTAELHPWYYTSVTLVAAPAGVSAVYDHGPWFWANSIYSYALLLAGTIWLFVTLLHASAIHRRQLTVITIGTLIPWLGNLIYVLGLSPLPNLDITPMMFSLAGLVYAWVIFELELFQLAPIARQVLVEEMSDGVLVLNTQDRVIDINPAAQQLLGVAAMDVVGRVATECLARLAHLDGRRIDVAQLPAERLTVSAGRDFLDMQMSVLRGRQGEVAGRLLMMRDVTEQRRADEARRESQRAFANLVSNLPGMAYRCLNDDGWTMLFVSQGCFDLTGYQPAELERNNRVAYAALIHPEDSERVWREIQERVRNHQSFRITYRIFTADGEQKWVWERGTGVYDAAGNVLALEGFISDISDLAHAQNAEREQRLLAEALRNAAAVLNSSLDLDDVLDRILEQVGSVIDFDAAAVYLIDGRCARIARWRAKPDVPGESLAHLSWDIDATPNMQVMCDTRRSVVINNTLDDPNWITRSETSWIYSSASAPICARDALLGFLEVDSTQPGYYVARDGERLQAFADHAALAVQNARLFAEAQRRADQMAMLNRIGVAITEGLGMEQVLRTVHEQCRQIADMDSFYVALYDAHTEDIRFPLFWDGGEYISTEPLNLRTQPSLTSTVISQRQTIYVGDTQDVDAATTYPIQRVGMLTRAYVGVPLIVRDQVVGVLSVQSQAPNAYRPEQVSLFETIATQAAMAIDNAQLYEQMQLEKHYLETLVASSQAGIVVIDAEGRVLSWNPAAERIFGYTSAEAIGRNIDLLVASASDEMLREGTRLTARAFGDARVRHVITQRMRKDGSLVDVEVYGTAEVVGRERGMILSYHDITELQATRKTIELFNSELRQRLDQLDEVNASLQARNEELDAFAHTVAHDLRSPLHNIVGYADLLRWDASTMASAEIVGLAAEVLQQARRMRNIINELLLLATVRKEDVRALPLPMGDIVAEALERLTDLLVLSEAEVITPAAWPVGIGYAPWIEEVWVNYVSNAINYGGKPPRVELGADVQGDAVRFWVRDNGAGVPPEARSRLFTPFTRLSQARASGHGLGLSIVQRIISKLGGEVGVESEDGSGSLFYFTLPSADQ